MPASSSLARRRVCTADHRSHGGILQFAHRDATGGTGLAVSARPAPDKLDHAGGMHGVRRLRAMAGRGDAERARLGVRRGSPGLGQRARPRRGSRDRAPRLVHRAQWALRARGAVLAKRRLGRAVRLASIRSRRTMGGAPLVSGLPGLLRRDVEPPVARLRERVPRVRGLPGLRKCLELHVARLSAAVGVPIGLSARSRLRERARARRAWPGRLRRPRPAEVPALRRAHRGGRERAAHPAPRDRRYRHRRSGPRRRGDAHRHRERPVDEAAGGGRGGVGLRCAGHPQSAAGGAARTDPRGARGPASGGARGAGGDME